jgi:hypothetical protein
MTDPDATHDPIALLQAVGMAEASGAPLDLAALADELGRDEDGVGLHLAELEAMGLATTRPPVLLRAGRQFLDARGEVPLHVLRFLPSVVDDLHARAALLEAGGVLVEEFREELKEGRGMQHAEGLVPPAFAAAVSEGLALDLFAAAVALMARLAEGSPAGCVAEEVMAVRLLEQAAATLDLRALEDRITEEELRLAVAELNGVYELFGDDDVLAMFEMVEPSDAAVAEHDPARQLMGVVDQRIESWFRPFGGVAPTGHISDR